MNYIEKYNNKIQNGELNACLKLKKVYAHVVNNMHNPDLSYIYDDNKAQMAIDFIESFCIIPKARGNPPFKLQLWQKALVSIIFGFINKETTMRLYSGSLVKT